MLDGYRESAESWKELLLDLKQRGLTIDPRVAIGDGALGFWKALPQVFGTTREQRCWVHKTANVLNKLPKGQQGKAKAALHEVWMAESRAKAEQAFDRFLTTYEAKYAKAAECLVKDRQSLLTFYGFPGGTLAASPHHQPDRIDFRYGAAANSEDAWLCLASRHLSDGFQVDEDGGTGMAQTEGARSPGPSGPRRALQRRTTRRGDSKNRRLRFCLHNI